MAFCSCVRLIQCSVSARTSCRVHSGESLVWNFCHLELKTSRCGPPASHMLFPPAHGCGYQQHLLLPSAQWRGLLCGSGGVAYLSVLHPEGSTPCMVSA